MKRICVFSVVLISIYVFLATNNIKTFSADVTDNSAEVTDNVKRIYKDISPELRVKVEEWMELLYSEDPAIRSSAVISLLGLNLTSVYDLLIDTLRNSENDDVRISLIKAFGFTGDDKALDCMVELLASEKEAIRIASVDMLGNMKTDRAIEKMINVFLNDKTPINSRILVAGALAKTHSREAVEPLISLLESDNNELGIATRNALVEITKQSDGYSKTFWQDWWDRNKVKTREQWLEDIVNELEEDIKKLESQNDTLKSEIAQKTIWLLESRKDKDDIKQLLVAIESEYLEVRIFAAKELASHTSPDVTEAFIGLISNNDPEMRSIAAKTLGEIDDNAGLRPLRLALQDKEIKVRESAAMALGKLKNMGAVTDLLTALNDKENSVICVVTEALGEIKATEAVGPIVNLLSSEDPKVRESAIVALGNIKDDKAIGPLINSLKDKEERVRWYAADSLGKIGDKKAVDPLLALFSDESARVRESAATALGQIGDESTVGPLIKLLQDKDERVVEKTSDVLLSIKCKKFETINSIVNAFYARKDNKRSVAILEKQLNDFNHLPGYQHALWPNKLKLAKLYFSSNNWQNAGLLYEELVPHFKDNLEIKKELVRCLKETKQSDKLLSSFSLWVTNVLTDNNLWWQGIYEILEEYFANGDLDKARGVINGLEKEVPHMGGPELKSKFYDLRKRSTKPPQPQGQLE